MESSQVYFGSGCLFVKLKLFRKFTKEDII